MLITSSGSFPSHMQVRVRSFSHKFLRSNPHLIPALRASEIVYSKVTRWDLAEVIALHKEWFPIAYPDSMYGSIGISVQAIGAFVNAKGFSQASKDLLVGLILFTVEKNENNALLSLAYCMRTTYSGYILTLGVVDWGLRTNW
jgi:hypothetical protein